MMMGISCWPDIKQSINVPLEYKIHYNKLPFADSGSSSAAEVEVLFLPRRTVAWTNLNGERTAEMGTGGKLGRLRLFPMTYPTTY